MSLCEEDCELIEYDPKSEKVKCSCDIKLNISPDYNTRFYKKEFFKSFIDINNIFNIKIMKCYKTVIKIKYLFKNYGFFIVGFIIILYFINLFIFISVSYNKIKEDIFNIVYSLKMKGNPIKKKKSNKFKNKKKKKKKFFDKKDTSIKESRLIDNSNLIKKNEIKDKKYINQITQNMPVIPNNKLREKEIMKNKGNNLLINPFLRKQDFELNSLEYIEAFKLDHRNYFQYYISLIKYNYPFFFSFGCYNDYNSKIIKMFLFFFSFCLDFAINALFFTDDTMHKKI